MICPVCGGAELIADVRDLNYTYKGQTIVLTQVSGDYCPACNESILDSVESRRVMDLQLGFHKKVDVSI